MGLCKIVYSRYYLPLLLRGFDGRVIYMDDDCIVQGLYLLDVLGCSLSLETCWSLFSGDVMELVETKVDDKHIGAFSTVCQQLDDRFGLPFVW